MRNHRWTLLVLLPFFSGLNRRYHGWLSYYFRDAAIVYWNQYTLHFSLTKTLATIGFDGTCLALLHYGCNRLHFLSLWCWWTGPSPPPWSLVLSIIRLVLRCCGLWLWCCKYYNLGRYISTLLNDLGHRCIWYGV